jgi:hypothetical protein
MHTLIEGAHHMDIGGFAEALAVNAASGVAMPIMYLTYGN